MREDIASFVRTNASQRQHETTTKSIRRQRQSQNARRLSDLTISGALICYLLSAICCQLSVVSYLLSAICYQLSVVSYLLSTICCQLSVISYQLSVTRRTCFSDRAGDGRHISYLGNMTLSEKSILETPQRRLPHKLRSQDQNIKRGLLPTKSEDLLPVRGARLRFSNPAVWLRPPGSDGERAGGQAKASPRGGGAATCSSDPLPPMDIGSS
jgi:hypothetical protein